MRLTVFIVAMASAVPATAREALTGFALDFVYFGDRKYCNTQFINDAMHSDAEEEHEDIERLIALDGSSKFMSMFLDMVEGHSGYPEYRFASIKLMDCDTNQSFVVDPAYANYEDLWDVMDESGSKDLTWWIAGAIEQAKNPDWEPIDKLTACVCGYLASGDFAKDRDFEEEN